MVCSKTHKDLVLAQTCAWHFGLRIRAVCGGARRKAVQGRSGPGQVRMTGRLELDRTHIHRGSVVKSWPKFCKVRDCGVCRARRSRGGLFPLAYSPSKAIGRNSQRSGIPTEILKIRVFGLFCVRASVYASVIRSAPQKSPPRFWILLHQAIFPGSSSSWPSKESISRCNVAGARVLARVALAALCPPGQNRSTATLTGGCR